MAEDRNKKEFDPKYTFYNKTTASFMLKTSGKNSKDNICRSSIENSTNPKPTDKKEVEK